MSVLGGRKLLIRFMLTLALLVVTAANSGVRHEPAAALSEQAADYYTGSYCVETLFALAGSASEHVAETWQSPLCAALHRLMNETRTDLLSYAETLITFPATDTEAGGSVPLRFYCDGTGSYNREQVWSELHGAFYHDGAGRDLHHLRPADSQANLARGTQCFGNVRNRFSTCEIWSENDKPVFWSVPDWNNGQGLVEVRDEIKGDVARCLLYVYVTYGEQDGANQNLWSDLSAYGTGLTSSDGLRVIESLDTLLAWMALDPVDTWELSRNDVVQTIQGNRNVFVDYPELAFCLFDREIPDMPTPSGIAHSRYCTVSAAADPPEGGEVRVARHTVTALPNPGWTVDGWKLSPEDAATVTRNGEVFTLSDLRADCRLTVRFTRRDPCAGGHAWDDGVLICLPACQTAGERCYTCTVCGETRTETVPALGHDWHRQAVEPSCTGFGYTLDTCSRCGAEVQTPGAPPLGHSWDEGTVTRAPTKTCSGERALRCTRCGASQTEEIPFRFVDVRNESLYYFTPVYWALYHTPPITAGTDDTHFSPCMSCTRAQIMTFLWRACGSPAPTGASLPFADVPPDAYYADAVCWAVEKGVTAGTSKTTFSPNAVCTRAQVVTFLWAASDRPEPGSEELPFLDVPDSCYYRRAVQWALARGITSGTSATTFSPDAVCTRAQVVTMLYQMLNERGPQLLRTAFRP